MPTFLHAADLHLDSPLRGLDAKAGAHAERIRLASRVAFERMISRAIEHKVAFALLAGDIYDTEPSFATYLYFHQQVARLKAAGIPVAIVLGNHDHAGVSPRSGRLPEGIRVLATTPESFEIVDGVCVHGQSYPRRDVSEDLTAAYPPPVPGRLNIGLLHTALNGYSGEHAAYAPSDRVTLANHGYDYWALGHVHNHQVVRQERGVPIVYPGNLQGRHARETGPKGAVFVDFEDGRIGGIRHESFDDVRWHHVSIDPAALDDEGDSLATVAAQIRHATATARDQGRLAAVRVTIVGNGPLELVKLGTEEIQHSLHAGMSGDADVFLEKVEAELQPRIGDRSEAEVQLRALVERLAADPSDRERLKAIAGSVGERLRRGDPSLVTQTPRMGAWSAPVTEELARERLEWALRLVRERLGLHGGPR